MDAETYRQLEDKLRRQGWARGADGSWTAPLAHGGAAVGGVEAGRAEPAPARALDGRGAKRQAGEGGVVLRVSLVTFRRQLLDRDAVAYAGKILTDAVAASLGVDDADPRVAWEWSQVRTDGEEGVAVRIEERLDNIERNRL